MRGVTRRAVLGGMTAAMAAPAWSQPATRPILIRGAYVMTMGPDGDMPEADVLVADGRIERVGAALSVPNVEIVAGEGRIVLPGFVDTHTHLWLSQMRGLFSRSEATAYFPLVEPLGARYRPEDMRSGTLFGAAGNLDAGITTTFPYCDNIRRPADAEAALAALVRSGTRARFHYTGHDALPPEDYVDLDHLRALAARSDFGGDGLIELAFGLRVPRQDGREAAKARALDELAIARALGLPISTHVSGADGPSQLAWLVENGLPGPDMLLVHATDAPPDLLAAVARAGAGVALTPITEQRVGFGITRISDFDLVEGPSRSASMAPWPARPTCLRSCGCCTMSKPGRVAMNSPSCRGGFWNSQQSTERGPSVCRTVSDRSNPARRPT